MNTHVLRLTREGAAPTHSRPAPDRVIAGDPVFTTWAVEEANGLHAGLWQSTPGAWRVSYDEWEYCHILEGRSVLIAEDGARIELPAGGSIVIRPGFRGIWEVIETTLKDYVIRI